MWFLNGYGSSVWLARDWRLHTGPPVSGTPRHWFCNRRVCDDLVRTVLVLASCVCTHSSARGAKAQQRGRAHQSMYRLLSCSFSNAKTAERVELAAGAREGDQRCAQQQSTQIVRCLTEFGVCKAQVCMYKRLAACLRNPEGQVDRSRATAS